MHGIRVLKAFGRGKHALEKFRGQAEELRGTEIEKARRSPALWLWLHAGAGRRLRALPARRRLLAADGQLTVGELVAFFATATVLRWPVESIGLLLAMTFEPRPRWTGSSR